MTNPEEEQPFDKARRLLKPVDYQRVFDHVKYKQSGQFCTMLATDGRLPQSRLGIIVAKKHIKLAVRRNHIKRLLRESFRTNCSDISKASGNIDVIVLVKSTATDVTNHTFQQELQKQWSKLINKIKKLN